jgi:hypothetical protein
MRSKWCPRQFQHVVGNYDNNAAINANGGGDEHQSNIASDVGQQATENNNHTERVGNYCKEEVGQKGDDRGDDSTTTMNDDNDNDKINNNDDDDKITVNYTVDY